ncbi:MAG: hypothetical protein C0497_05800 [Gemmatimonas sp.]|nr:hypothetical protein [Gemmatimonas sp.]
MVTGSVAVLGVVAAVALERLAELHLSRRNAAWATAHGGIEVGPGVYCLMAVFHVAFLMACVAEPLLMRRVFTPALAAACLVVLMGAQVLRWWAIITLGPRWNTRIIVIPDAVPVTGGPYRWVRHPNYVAVIAEMVALPLLGGAWVTALVATAGNALILRVRINSEERALGTQWARAFAATPRFVPWGSRDGS